MSNIHELKTGYQPVIETLDGLKLPLELKNDKNEVLIGIDYWKYDQKFHWYGNAVESPSVTKGFDTLLECWRDCFIYLYQTMQDYRKVSEKHNRLVGSLKESLSTPWNKLD